MTEPNVSVSNEVDIAHSMALIESELREGFLREVAPALVESVQLPDDITAEEVAEILVPTPKEGKSLAPRWTLQPDKYKVAQAMEPILTANEDRINDFAVQYNLRKLAYDTRQPEDTAHIDSKNALLLIPGGANKSSVARRGVALKAMYELYDDLSGHKLYQLGADRLISPIRKIKDEAGEEKIVSNAEYDTICTLAGAFLPEEGFTEYQANIATAEAEGYEKVSEEETPDGDIVTIMRHSKNSTLPTLIQIRPAGEELAGGLRAIKNLEGQRFVGRQPVIATNGQYRETVVRQAELWAKENRMNVPPAVGLGDEPGDRFPFPDDDIIVGKRSPWAYAQELIVLYRLYEKLLASFNQRQPEE